jgi:hypothetical protein
MKKIINHEAWADFAHWLTSEAVKRELTIGQLQPYAGFWAKVKTGRVRHVPHAVIQKIERAFRHTLEELANEAGVALFTPPSSDKSEHSHRTPDQVPLLEPEHEIAIVWPDGVPDHMWPYIAYQRGYFSDARIKVHILEPESVSDFPHGYGEAMKSCLPNHACCAATWHEMEDLHGWPIAVTHHFTGFACLGRAPSHIKPLERDSPQEFGRLIYELTRRNIASSRIGCITENSVQFLQLALKLGQECWPEMPKHTFLREAPSVLNDRSPHLLEELYELGELGCDLVVGHVLSNAIAKQNPTRYQIYFTWDRLRAIAEKIKSPLQGELEKLAPPVPFMLNHAPTIKDRALVCRLWSVAYRASCSIMGKMAPVDSALFLKQLTHIIPYSNPSDQPVTPQVFSTAWAKGYRPLTLEQMLEPIDPSRASGSRSNNLTKALTWVREEKSAVELAFKKLSAKQTTKNKSQLALIKQLIGWGNFYDARMLAEKLGENF